MYIYIYYYNLTNKHVGGPANFNSPYSIRRLYVCSSVCVYVCMLNICIFCFSQTFFNLGLGVKVSKLVICWVDFDFLTSTFPFLRAKPQKKVDFHQI